MIMVPVESIEQGVFLDKYFPNQLRRPLIEAQLFEIMPDEDIDPLTGLLVASASMAGLEISDEEEG